MEGSIQRQAVMGHEPGQRVHHDIKYGTAKIQRDGRDNQVRGCGCGQLADTRSESRSEMQRCSNLGGRGLEGSPVSTRKLGKITWSTENNTGYSTYDSVYRWS